MTNTKQKKVTNEKPISLAGVDFKNLLSAFLKVESEEEKQECKQSSAKKAKNDK